MRRLSIAVVALALPLGACVQNAQQALTWTPIPRPAPDDPTPAGIAYLCDGQKEVSVVYARNRASVTFDNKTWRVEYQPIENGFRYVDSRVEWAGRDDLVALRDNTNAARPLAFNCRPTRRTA